MVLTPQIDYSAHLVTYSDIFVAIFNLVTISRITELKQLRYLMAMLLYHIFEN